MIYSDGTSALRQELPNMWLPQLTQYGNYLALPGRDDIFIFNSDGTEATRFPKSHQTMGTQAVSSPTGKVTAFSFNDAEVAMLVGDRIVPAPIQEPANNLTTCDDGKTYGTEDKSGEAVRLSEDGKLTRVALPNVGIYARFNCISGAWEGFAAEGAFFVDSFVIRDPFGMPKIERKRLSSPVSITN